MGTDLFRLKARGPRDVRWDYMARKHIDSLLPSLLALYFLGGHGFWGLQTGFEAAILKIRKFGNFLGF